MTHTTVLLSIKKANKHRHVSIGVTGDCLLHIFPVYYRPMNIAEDGKFPSFYRSYVSSIHSKVLCIYVVNPAMSHTKGLPAKRIISIYSAF